MKDVAKSQIGISYFSNQRYGREESGSIRRRDVPLFHEQDRPIVSSEKNTGSPLATNTFAKSNPIANPSAPPLTTIHRNCCGMMSLKRMTTTCSARSNCNCPRATLMRISVVVVVVSMGALTRSVDCFRTRSMV